MSATFATIAFFTTTLIYIASMFQKIGPVMIRPFDAAVCSSYLIPVMSLYFARRWTDAKIPEAAAPLVNAINGAEKQSAPTPPHAAVPVSPDQKVGP
jgi:hypothetical protein